MQIYFQKNENKTLNIKIITFSSVEFYNQSDFVFPLSRVDFGIFFILFVETKKFLIFLLLKF